MSTDERAAAIADAFERRGADGARRVATETESDADDVGRAAKLVANPAGLLGVFSSRTRTMPRDWPHAVVVSEHAFG